MNVKKSDEWTMPDATRAVASTLNRLGTGNAATEMGAIEALSVSVEKAGQEIADAIHDLANAVRANAKEHS